MRRYAYYNGKIMPYEDIRIPLCDRSIYFGDAVYEAIIGRGGRVFLLSEHLDRLEKSAERISVKTPRREEIDGSPASAVREAPEIGTSERLATSRDEAEGVGVKSERFKRFHYTPVFDFQKGARRERQSDSLASTNIFRRITNRLFRAETSAE
jgi:branched-subunit amino acid aminotransferase/4-amino-4-deoxychorismate lyase